MSDTTEQNPTLEAAPAETSPEEEPLDADLQNKMNLEQKQLELATLQAQLNYLSGRVADLVKENHELRVSAG